MLKFAVCELARPLLVRLPAGSVHLLGLLGGRDLGDDSWLEHPRRIRVFWDRHINSWVKVDLADTGGRWHYFPGRYHDSYNQWLIRRVIRSGGWYVDIGANVGIHTLLASRLAGASGRVLAVEPNPDTRRNLELHLALNDATNVEVYPYALGNGEGSIQLFTDPTFSAIASVRSGDPGRLSIDVGLKRGDDLFPRPPRDATCLVKIDVEGSELEVIRGMDWWLVRPRTCFVIEITPSWIRQLNGSAEELFGRFSQQGYACYLIARKSKLYRSAPTLTPIERPLDDQKDYLFIRAEERRLFD
jgi:FkbM family methyltransferase